MLDINPINQNNTVKTNSDTQNQTNVNAGQKQYQPNQNINHLGMADTNEVFTSGEDNQRLIFYFTLVATIIVLVVCGYLFYLKSIKTQELKTKDVIQVDLNAKLSAPELVEVDKLASGYSIGLTQLSKFILAPTQYSILFNKLQMVIPNDVALDSFTVDEKNKMKIVGKASSLEATTKFIKAIESSDFFENPTLDSNQQNKDTDNKTTYTVTMSGTLNTKMLAGEEK